MKLRKKLKELSKKFKEKEDQLNVEIQMYKDEEEKQSKLVEKLKNKVYFRSLCKILDNL